MSKRRRAPKSCPVCGEDLLPTALACPECGADDNSGWRGDADSIDVGGSEFDYAEFVEQEFGDSPKPRGVKTVWWVTAIVLLVAFALFYALR